MFCCGEAQSAPISLPCPVWDFSVERALGALPARQRKRLLRFFLPRPLKTQADTILLTQQFSNLGLLGEGEQLALYRALGEGPLAGERLLIKKHPDDPLDYPPGIPRGGGGGGEIPGGAAALGLPGKAAPAGVRLWLLGPGEPGGEL